MASRFLNEIPEENMEWISKPEPRPQPTRWDDWADDGTVTYSQTAPVTPKKPMAEAGGLRKSTANSAPLLQLKAGESVAHDAFGQGMVLSVRPMGNDALIEVAFDKVGTKKLMLKAAGSHLKKL
jgi:DNA helicase-2/ATP-dependent DNA helicase PcrA